MLNLEACPSQQDSDSFLPSLDYSSRYLTDLLHYYSNRIDDIRIRSKQMVDLLHTSQLHRTLHLRSLLHLMMALDPPLRKKGSRLSCQGICWYWGPSLYWASYFSKCWGQFTTSACNLWNCKIDVCLSSGIQLSPILYMIIIGRHMRMCFSLTQLKGGEACSALLSSPSIKKHLL